MIQIRNGVFETNSSSTHSICISKKPVDADGCHVDFHFGEFGWENDDADVADYLYTAIYELDRSGKDGLLDKLKIFSMLMALPIHLKSLRLFTMIMVMEMNGTSLMSAISTTDTIHMSSYIQCLIMMIC